MGFNLSSFFSPKTQSQSTGQQQSQSNSSSTQTTQNNLWPQLSGVFSQYQNNFNPAPFNHYQTNAADRQDVVSNNLYPGFSAAGNIASGGLAPTAYQGYLSPFLGQLTAANQADQALTAQKTADAFRGNLATRGALGNNTGADAALASDLATRFAAQNAATNQAAFNTAQDTALKSQAQQLQGASTLAGLTGAATGANQAGFNMGQTLWQDPLWWQTQWASGLSPFLNAAGSTSTGSSTGSSSGTSSGTTTQTQTPSPFQIASGIVGLGTSMFGMPSFGGFGGGGMSPGGVGVGGSWGTPTGIPAPWTNPDSIPRANGGSVKGYDEGGAVTPGAQPSLRELPMMDKLKSAFDAFNGMAKAAGGGVKPFAGGGGVVGGEAAPMGLDTWEDSAAAAGGMGGEAAPMPVMGAPAMGAPGITAAPAAPVAPYRAATATQSQSPAVASYSAVAPSQPAAAPESGWGPMITGKWDSGAGPMSRSFLAMSGPLLGGPAAQQATQMVQEAQARRNAEDLHKRAVAQMMGRLDGKPTLERERMTASQAQQAADQAERVRQFNMTHGEQKRYHDAQILRMDPGWGIKQSIEARKTLAPQFGLKEGTDEYTDFVGTGKLPMKKTQAQIDWDKRYDAAVQYGGKAWADSEEGRNWILNYKPEKPSRVDTAFDTKIADLSAKDYEKRVEAARDSQSKLQTIDQLEAVVSNPNVYQGKGATYLNELKRAAASVGFPVEGVAETELLNSLGNQMALKLRSTAGGEGMPGALSDSDRRFLSASVPGVTNTRQGNQAMLYMMRKSEEYKIKANTVAMDYIAAKGSNIGLAQYMTAWMSQNPMFSTEDKRRINTLSGGKFADLIPPTPAAPAPGTVVAPGTMVSPSPSSPASPAGPRSDPVGLR